MKRDIKNTSSMRKSIASNPRMKEVIDDKLMKDEQAVIKMMDAVEREVVLSMQYIPYAIQLLDDHITGGKPLDPSWSIVYTDDDDMAPVVVYKAQHGVVATSIIIHPDGFARVKMSVLKEWWNANDFDELDVDMVKRVDVANKFSDILAAIIIEHEENMMALTVETPTFKTFAAVDKEPRKLSDSEWTSIQHERNYTSCSCGMHAGGGFREMMAGMLGGGNMAF